MSPAQQTIQKVIIDYKRAVQAQFPHSRLYVFGSTARGQRVASSDIDMVVVAQAFRPLSGMKRLALLSSLRRGKAREIPMDIVGLTPAEFRTLKNGKNLYWRSVVSECVEE